MRAAREEEGDQCEESFGNNKNSLDEECGSDCHCEDCDDDIGILLRMDDSGKCEFCGWPENGHIKTDHPDDVYDNTYRPPGHLKVPWKQSPHNPVNHPGFQSQNVSLQ